MLNSSTTIYNNKNKIKTSKMQKSPERDVDHQTYVKRLIKIFRMNCASQRKTHTAASQRVRWNSLCQCALVARINSVFVLVSPLFVDDDKRYRSKKYFLGG